MKNFEKICFGILIAISFTIKSYGLEPPNIVNEFYITKDTFNIDYSDYYDSYNNKLLITYYSSDRVNNASYIYPFKIFNFTFSGELIKQYSLYSQGSFHIFNSSFDKISDIYRINGQYFYLNGMKYFSLFLDKDFNIVNKIEMDTIISHHTILINDTSLHIHHIIASYPVRFDDSLYFGLTLNCYNEHKSYQRYKVLVTDTNYKFIRYFELDTMNLNKNTVKSGQRGFWIYPLENKHLAVGFEELMDTVPNIYPVTIYDYDNMGNYYSKKKYQVLYNNDSCRVILQQIIKLKDNSYLIRGGIIYNKNIIQCFFKVSSMGEIMWYKVYDNEEEMIGIIDFKVLFNEEVIALGGRIVPSGYPPNEKYPSYLALYDINGNKLSSYKWHHNISLDGTVFGVMEGPNKHIFVVAKNGFDSLVVSEIVPNYTSAKENSVLSKNIYLSPNPTTSTAYVNLQQEGQVAITAVDLLGRSFPLWSGYASTGDMELDVSTLPIGSYTLLIDYGTKREAVRLMKE